MRKNHRAKKPSSQTKNRQLQFIEHVYELRRRLFYIAASMIVWGCGIYAIQQHIVSWLLRPAEGQHFIYTSVGGGIDFLFRICVYGSLVLSLPIILYNLLSFVEPIIESGTRRFIFVASFISAILAVVGVTFGYFIGLPAALHFLLHQFTTIQIQPLLTIQSYLHFVIIYMVGSALLFQLPLILVCINRIKPLKPKKLLHYERWVILAAFLLSGLMNPTPNIISQLLVAGPFIVMYQVAIILIAIINRFKNRALPATDSQGNIQTVPTAEAPPEVLSEQPRATAQQSLYRHARRSGLIWDISGNQVARTLTPFRPAFNRQLVSITSPNKRLMDFSPSTADTNFPRIAR